MSQNSSDHLSHASRAPAILIGNLIPQALASLFVLARIACKLHLDWRRTWAHEDTVICLSWATSLALTVMSCLQTRYGAGQHIYAIPLRSLKPALQLAYGTLIAYNLALALTKISVCLFYLRVFCSDPAAARSRRLVVCCMAFVAAYTVPLEIVSIAQCRPASAVWEPGLAGARCVDTVPAFYASAASNMAVDAALVAFVVPRVLPLPVPRRQKAVLLFFVSLGWVIIIASIVRVVRISTILRAEDKTWVSYDSSIWSAVEVDVGLICVSAPATRKLLQKIAPGFARSFRGSVGGGNAERASSGSSSTRVGGTAAGKPEDSSGHVPEPQVHGTADSNMMV
ncbi:Integral membrane protein [Neofusicoccum parvum]|nr:Integral membrane protein [Neofusicoccum parvum]